MVDRIDIERALDNLVSNEGGMGFQGLAVVLAKLRWPELIACERHNDLGLDAYASPILSPDRIGKGLACSITPTFKKLSRDANVAKEHYRSLSVLIFATPNKVTKPVEKDWSDKIRTEYGYELVVISREEIIALLQLPDNAGICRTHLKIPVPYQPPIADLLQQAREAAAAVAADWAAHPRLAGKPQIALNAVALDERGSETREVFTTARLRTLLLQGRRIVLEAPAGRGKTTTLVQLAQAEGASQGIPVLINLPAWIRSGLDILEYIARIPAFRARGIDATGLARLAQAEPYLFLLNGWNEISELHSQDAADALRTLERAFLAAGIIVATRTHHIFPPLPGSARIRLLSLTPDQRFHYLERALGTVQAHELNSKLSRERVLDELTRTPFILSEVTTIFRSGREIPRTKLGLLGAVVDLMQQSEEHRTHLQTHPLWGRAEDYLRPLATRLTVRGDVMLGEAEARTICHSVSERLRRAGQIATSPEPAEILSTLSSHNILERIDYPGISFRFQHQQFQEYYSALMLRETLTELVASGDPAERDAFAQKYINEPAWEEPLRMIAENLGVAKSDIAAGKVLVQSALRLDPIFAANLSRLSGSSVWSEVRSDLRDRLRSLYAVPSQHYRQCALAAMLATGSDEFADILLPLLTSHDQQVRLATYRAGTEFHLSSLGSQWQQIVAGWTEQQRIEFVSELTIHQGKTEVGLTFARSDPSPTVRVEALRVLAWMGQRYDVAHLLQSLSDAEFGQALQKLDVDDIPLPLRARAISGYNGLLAGTTDPKARLQIALALAELNDSNTLTRLKEELSALPSAMVKELSDYSLRPAVDLVRRADPQWVSQWVADRIIEGVLWGDNWLSLVSGIPKTLSEQLLQRASTEDLRRSGNQGVISLLAATADAALAKAVFVALCDHRRALIADARNEEKQAIGGQLGDLFQAIPAPVAVEGLSDMLTRDPQDDELRIVTEVFSRMGSRAEDPRSILPDHLRQQLRLYLKSAVPRVLSQDDFRGEAKARLASTLAEVGDADDMADLLTLIRSDIERVRNGRASWARGDRSARGQGGTMSYSNWHVQALVRLDPTQSELILCDLLQESEYELDAAWALRAIAKKQPSARPIIDGRFGWPTRDYRKVQSSPPEWSTLFDEERRVKTAAVIKQRILDVLEESKSGNHKVISYHYRLKEFAKVLASLDPQHSADLILEIAALPGTSDGWHRLALVESLIFGGVPSPADAVIQIFDPVIVQFRRHGVYNDSLGLLTRFLCILPFVDPTALGIVHARELSQEFRLPLYALGDLLIALSQSGCEDGLALLRNLARQNNGAFQQVAKEWIEAIAACPLRGARSLLLSFIDPEVTDGVGDLSLPDYAVDLLAACLSELAQADSDLAERILQLSSEPLSPQRRLILAKVIAWLDSPQSLLAGLNLIDDNAAEPIPYDLWKAIEDVFLDKRPYKGNPQSYTLVPRAASDIKKRLFEMVEHDSRRARSAYNLLGQIEAWRLEYGRPTSEPRHPACGSGGTWPPPPPKAEGLDKISRNSE